MRLDEAAVALKYSICDADLITPTDVKNHHRSPPAQ